MTPSALFFQLGTEYRRRVHLSLCEDALPTWIGYVREKPSALRYRDSVVGMRHHVDVELPADALRSAGAGVDLADVGNRYLEPITALQDDDLAFPDPVEFAYYAIYNCFRKYVGGDNIEDWLIVNQALSAHDSDQAAPRLTRTINEITRTPPANRPTASHDSRGC
ncbi:hypothetical protein [Nocardia nova]|jgi:hypothetical protein|uniref:hypothetical protein n=1 Tax=Nocardia nova TaxID=37330 RepID=UPI0007A47F21|nr:hypothetical protein [Nocardia nova]MBV7703098.1 hypothetical protein [Nocardia nova]PPJ04410.1 hypothetical protein C5E51_25705 [Nocardia nova]